MNLWSRLSVALVAIVIGSILLALGVRSCYHPTIPTTATTLRSDEALKLTHTPDTIVVARRNEKDEVVVKNVPNYGHGFTYVQRTNGTFDIHPNELGVSNDFGLSVDFKSIGVADEFFYYRRLSLLGGSHFINLQTSRLQLHLFVAGGYRLPWTKVNNVSVFVGFDTDRKVMGGLFLRLGNS